MKLSKKTSTIVILVLLIFLTGVVLAVTSSDQNEISQPSSESPENNDAPNDQSPGETNDTDEGSQQNDENVTEEEPADEVDDRGGYTPY